MIHRHAARFIRHLLQQFRAGAISAAAAAAELEISLRRFYGLWHSYLQAVARQRAHRWQPGVSGGNRRRCWPEPVTALMRKLLGSRPPCPYSFIASEVHRRCDLKLHRASVRRWALAQGLAPAGPTAKPARPVRRWQVQQVGQLWQYPESFRGWFVGQDWQPPLLEILDDHSRVITVKRAPEYPGRFLDDDQAVAYFNRYFTWYDTEHYHSGIDYVTPQQAHQGLRQKIVAQRRNNKLSQRRRRREENQKQKTGRGKTNNHITMAASLVA